MFLGAQFVTLSFAQPTPEDRKVLDFTRDIRLGLLPATVVLQPEWLTPSAMALLPVADMEALLARLAPGQPRLSQDTPITERVYVPQASLSPLSLVHPLMVSLVLVPATTWHMMHKNPTPWG